MITIVKDVRGLPGKSVGPDAQHFINILSNEFFAGGLVTKSWLDSRLAIEIKSFTIQNRSFTIKI